MFTFKSDRFPDERVEADSMLEGDIDEACVVFLSRTAPSGAASGTVVYVYREPDLDLPERALTKKKDGAWSFEDLPSDGTPDQPDPSDSITVYVIPSPDAPPPQEVTLIPPPPGVRHFAWVIAPTLEVAQAQAQAQALRDERQAILDKLSPREKEVLGVNQ
jgi:hypothetical protein